MMRLPLTIAFVLSSLAGIASASAQEKVGFRLDWSLQGTHSPWFLAQERGYFREAGLDVTIHEGQGSGTVVQLIASGKGEQIGFADYATMMRGVENGLPVVAVFGINQTSPMIIASRADNPVPNPKALEGKVLAMAPAESTAQVFPALAAASGLDATKVNVLNPAVGAKLALLLQGRVDAITAGLNGQVPQLEAQGLKVSYFKYADFGVNTLNNGIVVNREFLKAKPEVVRGFLRAQSRAWEEARKNPGASIDALLKAHPQLASQRQVLMRQLELTFETLETTNTKGKPLGWMADADWTQTQELMVKYAGLKASKPIGEYFTNDFIPAAR